MPDLFWRIQPNVELGYTDEDCQRAFDLYTKFDQDTGIEDIQSTINTLKHLETVNQETGIGSRLLLRRETRLSSCLPYSGIRLCSVVLRRRY